jgi:hypothetical protein
MDEQTDRQTDMKKLIVAFHNLANMPKNKGCYADDLDNKYYQGNSYNYSCHTDYSIHEHEAYQHVSPGKGKSPSVAPATPSSWHLSQYILARLCFHNSRPTLSEFPCRKLLHNFGLPKQQKQKFWNICGM